MTIDDSNTKIWYGGSECLSANFGTLSAVTCTVAAVESGDNTPIVLVDQYGFASYSGAA